MRGWSPKVLWKDVVRSLTNTNSFQIILLSVAIHSVVSIFLIYLHLGWFFEYEISNYHPKGLSGKHGGISFARRRQQLNLIENRDLDPNNLLQGFRGWWTDHTKWNHEIMCFPQKWLLCSKVLTVKGKGDNTVKGIYQYIPIRKGVLLQSMDIAMRARTEGSMMQDAQEKSVGLYALIQTDHGPPDVVKLEIPTEVEDWTRRSISYSSPAGTRIQEITLMLYSHGYSGLVSFTDVEVIPTPDKESWLSSLSIAASCPSEVDRVVRIENPGHFNLIQAKNFDWQDDTKVSQSPSQDKLTLGVHVSLDRLSILERSLLTWKGKVSLAIFVAVKDIRHGLLEWQRLYILKKVNSLGLRQGSQVKLLLLQHQEEILDRDEDVTTLKDDPDDSLLSSTAPYPINSLRNIVISMTDTDFILMIDADFQVSPGLDQDFMTYLSNKSSTTDKTAFVIPAFEYLDTPKTNEVIGTKEELIRKILSSEEEEDPVIQPFQSMEAVDSHKLTNYWRWYSAKDVYPLRGFHDKYEPYVIVERRGLPAFDETFTGYGMNKVTHSNLLFASGYSFKVLPNSWMIHLPHKSSSFFRNFLQSPLDRIRNRRNRFHFWLHLLSNYSEVMKKSPHFTAKSHVFAPSC